MNAKESYPQLGSCFLSNFNIFLKKETKTLETRHAWYLRGIMEKIWQELKKIEAQAEQIRIESQDKAKKITTLAHKEAEKLIENGKAYADDEAQKLHSKAIQEANKKRDEQLKASQAAAEKLKAQAEKRMDKAVLTIVNSVLGETKP